MNGYEAARERYEQAVEARRVARENGSATDLGIANLEWDAADAELSRYETAPGIPLPEYRKAAA